MPARRRAETRDMVRRHTGFRTLLALPLALFSAMPSVEWCYAPRVPLTPEAFAACLASEFTGCTAEVECGAASCAAADDSPSCPPSLACEDAVRVKEGEPCAVGSASENSPGADAAPDPALPDRAFCVGGPAGGPGLRPSLDDDSRPLGDALATSLADVARPIRDAGVPLAAPRFEPIPDPPEAATPIRGPPRA